MDNNVCLNFNCKNCINQKLCEFKTSTEEALNKIKTRIDNTYCPNLKFIIQCKNYIQF